MGRKISHQQAAFELAAVREAFKKCGWVRPLEVATATTLSVKTVLDILTRLKQDRDVEVQRREYWVPRLHHGRDRTRRTSRLVVEYRVLFKRKTVYPTWLMPVFIPPKNVQKTAHRLC